MTINDALRPTSWDAFIGQAPAKRLLEVAIQAALRAEPPEPMGHVLLTCPPGFGKTTIATLIADQLGDPLVTLMCSPAVKPNELFLLLRSQPEGCVLFLDEIHRLTTAVQECLLSLLAEGYLQVGNKVLECGWVTVIAATTEGDDLVRPLVERFDMRPETGLVFEDYADDELGEIVRRMCRAVNVDITDEDTIVLGRATAGVPRTASQFVKAMRRLQLVDEPSTAKAVLEHMQVDGDGLTRQHYDYMRTVQKAGGVAGLQKLVDHLRVDEGTLRELERLLVKLELITYEPRGRELTPAGYRKINPQGSRRRALAG